MSSNLILLSKRKELENQIVGTRIYSKFTGNEGVITSINNKYIYLDFTCFSSISLSFETFVNCVVSESELLNNINDYLDTYVQEKNKK